MNEITSFRDQYGFLSNFYPCVIEYEGMTYPTVEHAYQAAKTDNLSERKMIQSAKSAGEAKKLGRKVHMIPNWGWAKYVVMRQLIRQKFAYSDLMARLLETGTAYLIEGNTWGDKEWGAVWNGAEWVGNNHLGRLLMEAREGWPGDGDAECERKIEKRASGYDWHGF